MGGGGFGSRPKTTLGPTQRQHEGQHHFVSQKLDFLHPLPLFIFIFFLCFLGFFCPTALNPREDFQGDSHTLPTGHCIVIIHIRLLTRQEKKKKKDDNFVFFGFPGLTLKHQSPPYESSFFFFFGLFSKKVLTIPFKNPRKRPN